MRGNGEVVKMVSVVSSIHHNQLTASIIRFTIILIRKFVVYFFGKGILSNEAMYSRADTRDVPDIF